MGYNFSQRSTSAKSSILKKLKAQISDVDYSKLPQEVPFSYPALSLEEMEQRFLALLKANHAEVVCVKPDTVMDAIRGLLINKNITSLLYGQETSISSQLESCLGKDDGCILVPFDFQAQAHKGKIFYHVDASITTSDWAIAETGTIVRWPTAQEPRTMSLVPPIHFIVVNKNTLHDRFSSVIKNNDWNIQMPTNALLISGPSKTAHIQQTLAFGAHAPKALIVLYLQD